MSTDEEAAPISANASACLNAFRQCLQNASNSVLGVRQYSDIEDQTARFSIWTSNMAVFSAAKSCLDHRLREAKDVQRLMLGMLEVLKGRIMACEEVIALLPPSKDQVFTNSFVEFEKMTAALATQVGLFHEVSNVIRKASKELQNSKAAKSFIIEDFEGNKLEDELQRFYALNLLDRFPESSPEIRERLATSMILRRKRILYRRARYSNIPMKPPRPVPKPVTVVPSAMRQTHQGTELDGKLPTSTRAERLFPALSQVHSLKTATTLDPERFRKASAPSVVSSTRYTDINDDEDLVFPPPPFAPSGQMSEMSCPFCLYVLPRQKFVDLKSWREHILADLEPLVCLFDPCDKPEVLYSHKQDWLRHMRKHTERWRCKTKSHSLEGATFEEFLTHMKVDHQKNYDEEQIELLAEKGVQSKGPLFEVCPLCGAAEEKDNLADGDMIAHIVGHLRSIALRSLPPLYLDDEDITHDDYSDTDGSRSTIKHSGSSLGWDDNSQVSRPELDVPENEDFNPEDLWPDESSTAPADWNDLFFDPMSDEHESDPMRDEHESDPMRDEHERNSEAPERKKTIKELASRDPLYNYPDTGAITPPFGEDEDGNEDKDQARLSHSESFAPKLRGEEVEDEDSVPLTLRPRKTSW